MGAIRGAICAENTREDISLQAVTLVNEILSKNNLQVADVEAVIFSATSDLDVCYPAQAVREHFVMDNVAFMCFAEMPVQGALDHCLRVCVLTPKLNQKDCKHCYLGRAKCLRSDLSIN